MTTSAPPPERGQGCDAARGEQIVAALRSPAAYPGREPVSDVIETHRAWVFLCGARAYKLAKRGADLAGDPSWLEQRRCACRRELELNRRLARDVYLEVVPVTCSERHIRVGGQGEVIDWVLMMRRLPRELMLDAAIADGRVTQQHIDALARTLQRFYREAEPVRLAPPDYRRRLSEDVEAKRRSLASEKYGIARQNLGRLAASLQRWLERHAEWMEARAQHVVDAHGDLRPEHVCLEPEPVIIDCLEFDATLRQLDPLSEVSFLALECRRLKATWVGAALLSPFEAPIGPRAKAFVGFYQAYHCMVRAAVAIWHLDDTKQAHTLRWKHRAEAYLELGVGLLELSPACAG